VEVEGTNYIVPADVPKVSDIPSVEALPGLLLSLPSMIGALSKQEINAAV
jgi:hypothetical protein